VTAGWSVPLVSGQQERLIRLGEVAERQSLVGIITGLFANERHRQTASAAAAAAAGHDR